MEGEFEMAWLQNWGFFNSRLVNLVVRVLAAGCQQGWCGGGQPKVCDRGAKVGGNG